MQYQSTRNVFQKATASQAILQGLSPEGGLFVPESLPALTKERLEKLVEMDYIRRAQDILGDFLEDFTAEEVAACVNGAYGGEKFANAKIAPLSKLGENTYLLELWHGPTCAFKDMALQMLPRTMVTSAKKSGKGEEIIILVATSGDTGKAALEGFCDVPGIRILVFYPEEGVSPLQKKQILASWERIFDLPDHPQFYQAACWQLKKEWRISEECGSGDRTSLLLYNENK